MHYETKWELKRLSHNLLYWLLILFLTRLETIIRLKSCTVFFGGEIAQRKIRAIFFTFSGIQSFNKGKWRRLREDIINWTFLGMNLCKWLKFKIHSLHLRASWLLWNMKVREIIDSYFNTQNHFSYQWMIKQGNNINVKIIPFEMIDTCIFQSQYWLKKYMWKIFFPNFHHRIHT